MTDNKIEAMGTARKFDFDYWDGERRYGFGGYKYISGHWTEMAKSLIERYSLSNSSKILDIGCGKGYLLYELQLILPNIEIWGIDISRYALENMHPEIKGTFYNQDARKKLIFENNSFDLCISINTLHNFDLPEVVLALSEMQRLAKEKYLVVEAYRNLDEFFNLQCWALTAPTLIQPREWKWLFEIAKYDGDFEFIYFESLQ
jgi:ubiquinone/menaquinone biosynthesis C-methylase UbiE